MKAHPEMAPWFFGVWISLALVGLWFTYLDKNITRKKRLIPVFIVGARIIFVLFTFLMTGSNLRMMGFVIPAVALFRATPYLLESLKRILKQRALERSANQVDLKVSNLGSEAGARGAARAMSERIIERLFRDAYITH